MESSTLTYTSTISDHNSGKEGPVVPHLHSFDVGSLSDEILNSRNQFQSMNALEILRETVKILRYNSAGFVAITVFLICPVSAVLLSNLLVNKSLVKILTIRILLLSRTSGLPLKPFIEQSCQHFVETAISSTMCFPLFITLSLLSKAAVVYSVDCTYSRKKFDLFNFCVIIRKIWKRLVFTYLWMCMVIVGCVTSFFVLLVTVCSTLSVIGFTPDLNFYAAIVVGLVFSIMYANAIIICNIAIVISVLEDVSGPQALLHSGILIKGQTQVGLLIYLGSTIGMAFIEGLFEHRVKIISYGDGSSRIWEGPLLLIMYSFVVLIDSIMSSVFYLSCRSSYLGVSDGEHGPVLENITSSTVSGTAH